jgi:Chitin binding Peritrophin-A domain
MQQDRECPDGLEFSAFEEDCIDAEFSNCFVESDICGETPFFHQTYFLSSRNCSEFYMCFLHILSHWQCPLDEIFHLDTETCGADTNPACEVSFI